MKTSDRLQPVLTLLSQYAATSTILVAIDGHSAAGKSSLARSIQEVWTDVTIIHTDDFYRPMNEVERASLDEAGGYHFYYDWQRLENQVLVPLSTGNVSQYQKYNWITNQLDAWEIVEPKGIIIVEGCYAARPELRAYYHTIILVETSPVQRLQRQYERADAPEWLDRWDAAERYYMQQYQPQAYAHLIIAGE